MTTPIHNCIRCGADMEKVESQVEEYMTIDLGSTGPSGVTVASSISGEVETHRAPGTSITRSYGPMFDSGIVILVPYRCPKCGYEKSFPK